MSTKKHYDSGKRDVWLDVKFRVPKMGRKRFFDLLDGIKWGIREAVDCHSIEHTVSVRQARLIGDDGLYTD